MKKKRDPWLRTSALLMALALLLSGCFGSASRPTAPETEPGSEPAGAQTTEAAAPIETTAAQLETTRAPEPTPETTQPPEPSGTEQDPALIRWKNAGQRDYLPDEQVELVPFAEMVYVRPDVAAIYADFDALTQRAKDSADAEALLAAFFDLYDRYTSFYSMDALAHVRYSMDTTQDYYRQEYDHCEAEAPNLEEKLEALYKAFGASACRERLEELYFTEGFFEKYDDYQVYTDPEYLRLSQEESALLAEYRALTSDIQVTYRDQTRSLDEWMQSQNYFDQFGALQAYYDQYNSRVGALFVQLVNVRQQLAAALGYESYAEYSYEMSYFRDYTPEEGSAFLKEIQTHLLPVLEAADLDEGLMLLDHEKVSQAQLGEMVGSAAENIGGSVLDAYRFMQAYSLCDIDPSAQKLDASYMTYIYDYEAPFVFLNSEGSSLDYTTFSHEFGHFIDYYYNYAANEDLETAETFSQAMEFLALTYTDSLSDAEKNKLIKMNLLDQLSTFVQQAAFADFEVRVYALAPEELTVEAINEIFLQCSKDYGIYEPGFDFYFSQSWIDVIHFFEVPYYIISYCVSAETSLQVYRLETETKGAGVAAYFKLLDRDYSAGVQQIAEDAGLRSPFQAGLLQQTAAFFRQQLDLKE